MDIMNLYGHDFADRSADPVVTICGGGKVYDIYKPNKTGTKAEVDLKIEDALKYLNQNRENWVVFQRMPGGLKDHPSSIRHAVVNGKCVKKGELTGNALNAIFNSIRTIVVDDVLIEKLVASYDPPYCK